jgi:hypothetical protein
VGLFGLRPALAAFIVLVVVGGIAALPPIQALWLPGDPSPVKRSGSGPPAPESVSLTPTADEPAARPAKEVTSTADSAPAQPSVVDQDAPAASAKPAASAAPVVSATAYSGENTPVPAAASGVASKAAPAEPPAYLGIVVLQSRETLWRLVGKVYGEYDPSHLESILKANPQIHNPKKVEVGSAVRIPAIPARVESAPGSSWWIRLGEKALLEEAIDAYRHHPEAMPPIRIVPHWHPSTGLNFSILLKERFTDEEAARLEIERLKTASGIDAALVSEWAPETVFYADPYQQG